jgi:hypothetical protein
MSIFLSNCLFLGWFLGFNCMNLFRQYFRISLLFFLCLSLLLLLFLRVNRPVKYLDNFFLREDFFIGLLIFLQKVSDHLHVIGIFLEVHFEFVFTLLEDVFQKDFHFLNGDCRLIVFWVYLLPSVDNVLVIHLENWFVLVFLLLCHLT